MFARQQFEHGESLSQRTFRERQTTQLRALKDGLLLLDAGNVAFSSEGEAEALAGDAGVAAAEIVTGGTCNILVCPVKTFDYSFWMLCLLFCFGRRLGSTIDGAVSTHVPRRRHPAFALNLRLVSTHSVIPQMPAKYLIWSSHHEICIMLQRSSPDTSESHINAISATARSADDLPLCRLRERARKSRGNAYSSLNAIGLLSAHHPHGTVSRGEQNGDKKHEPRPTSVSKTYQRFSIYINTTSQIP